MDRPIPEQHQVGGQFGRLGTCRSIPSQGMRGGRSVGAAAVRIASQLAADRGRRPPKLLGDLPHSLTTRSGQGDLLTLGEGEAAILQVPPSPRPYATGLDNPATSHLSKGPDSMRGVGDELAVLHRFPERLRPRPPWPD